MTNRKNEQGQTRPRDIIRLPNKENAESFAKDGAIEALIQAGYTPAAAEKSYQDLMDTFDDPERFAQFAKTQELSRRYGDETVLRTLQGMAEYLEERDKPKPALKVWTGAEDERRAKPIDGKGTPDRR